MQAIVLYVITAVIFLGADAVALRVLIKPTFEKHIGDWLLDSPRMLPALIFYLFYVLGLVWLVSLPALSTGSAGAALFNGAVLGAVAYGTYEFTNYATLKRWAPRQVALDGIWGTLLTAVSAWLGVLLTMSLFG